MRTCENCKQLFSRAEEYPESIPKCILKDLEILEPDNFMCKDWQSDQMQYNQFYIPHTKKELLIWFKTNKPEWRNMAKKSKKQLYAIYYKEREEVKM